MYSLKRSGASQVIIRARKPQVTQRNSQISHLHAK